MNNDTEHKPKPVIYKPKPVIIEVEANKAFEKMDENGNKIGFRDKLVKTDIISIKLGNIDLLKSTNLKEDLKAVSDLQIQAFSTSYLDRNKTKDDKNFKLKINAVIDYVNAIKNLKTNKLEKADKDLIDSFFKKYKDKYGNFDKTQTDKTQTDKTLTTEIILKSPHDIEYLTPSTETTTIDMRNNKGAEKDADDLLKFLTVVVKSREKFNTALETLKTIETKIIKSRLTQAWQSMGSDFKDKQKQPKYKYYVEKNQKETGNLINDDLTPALLQTAKYVGINTDANTNYSMQESFDEKNKLMKTYADDFQLMVERIFNNKSPTPKGGRKSRKLSKGGRRRKTRSNKFA